jgi:adenylate cyclase
VSTLHTMAIAQSLAGRLEAARATVAQIRELEPGLTASSFLARSPGGRFEHARRYAEALASAGLPAA